MPKFFCFFLLSVFLVGAMPSAVYADAYGAPPMSNPPSRTVHPTPVQGPDAIAKTQRTESYGTTISKKLGAGLSNMALGFLEIPKNVVNTSNEVNFALGITGGVAKGILYAGGRVLCGIVDFLTFPAPTEPLTTPQFVWMHFPEETRFNPAFKLKK